MRRKYRKELTDEEFAALKAELDAELIRQHSPFANNGRQTDADAPPQADYPPPSKETA
jgi:hypothetical protein